MPTRRRSFALTILSFALLTGCVGAPDDVAMLDGKRSLSRDSEHGLVEASVSLESPKISRGPNDFAITLRALADASAPTLMSVDASMAAHGHRASAANIVSDGQTFHALDLDLFMSGRWQIVMGVELDASSDQVEFALDVP